MARSARLFAACAAVLTLAGCDSGQQALHAGEQGDISPDELHKRRCAVCPDEELTKDIKNTKDPGDADDDDKAKRGYEVLNVLFCVRALANNDGVAVIAPKALACIIKEIAHGVGELSQVAKDCGTEAAKAHGKGDEPGLALLMTCVDGGGPSPGLASGDATEAAEYGEKNDGLKKRFGEGFIKSEELAQLFEPPTDLDGPKVKPLQWDTVNKLMVEFRYAMKYMVKHYLTDIHRAVENALSQTPVGEPQDSVLESSRAEAEPAKVAPRMDST